LSENSTIRVSLNSNTKDKAALRQLWKSQYEQHSYSFSIWNNQICSHILSHPKFQSAQKVAMFYPRDWEVNLTPLWRQRPEACGFPKTDSKNWEMRVFRVNSLTSPDFVVGVGKVMEPQGLTSMELENFGAEDLILIPGLAFDEMGARVGSGKGVYDRFLSHQGKKAHKWGVAFSLQICPEPIPVEPHDVPLDALVTEKGFIYF
jgi:5-formyltetrahydrofolate cyclo-ligase